MKIVSNGKTLEVGGDHAQDIYSTEEQVVGTWIDGKPVYERTLAGLTGPSKANDAARYTFEDLNIDMLVSYSAIAHRPASAGYVSLPYRTSDAAGDAWMMILPTISEPNTVILGGYASSPTQTSSWWSCNVTMVLRYTKTTDTAAMELPAMTAAGETKETEV